MPVGVQGHHDFTEQEASAHCRTSRGSRPRSASRSPLRWDDIDLKAGELHVRQRADRYNVIGSPKSKAGHRTVPLGPEVRNVLSEIGEVNIEIGGYVRNSCTSERGAL
jgi:integrase